MRRSLTSFGPHMFSPFFLLFFASLSRIIVDRVSGTQRNMYDLDSSTSNELCPEDPPQGLSLFHVAADDGADDGTTHRTEHQESDGVFLVVGFPHVGENPERDTTAGGGQST